MEVRIKKPAYLREADAKTRSVSSMAAALMALYAMGVFYYGYRVLLLLLCGMVTAVVVDAISARIRAKRRGAFDLSSVVTGMLIPLMLPASVDYQLIVAGVIFALVVAKYAFGGFGNNIFNPAAAAMCFLTVCYPQRVFLYPAPLEWLSLGNLTVERYADAPAALLKFAGMPQNDLSDMLLGSFAGPLGATAVLVILSCGLFLWLRRIIRPAAPVAFLLMVLLLSFLFPRAETDNLMQLLGYEMMSGSILFAAVFMITEPITSPRNMSARVIYGALIGVLTMLICRIGAYQEGVWFAILIANFFSALIDEAIVNLKLSSVVSFLRLRQRLTMQGGELQ